MGPGTARSARFLRVSAGLAGLADGASFEVEESEQGGLCLDCSVPLRTPGSKRCPACAMRHAQANRGPTRLRRPNREAVRDHAARLPIVLEQFLEEAAPDGSPQIWPGT